jgi:hypothetical protein
MNGYIARKSDRWYAVVYEGVDPETGKERRRWVPAGTDRADAEALAARLGAREEERRSGRRSQMTSPGSSSVTGCPPNSSSSHRSRSPDTSGWSAST